MMVAFSSAVALVIVSEFADCVARPYPGGQWLRSLTAWPFRMAATAMPWGALLVLTGSATTSAIVTMMLLLTAALGSNVKRRILGEALCFTDFALVREMLRHPRFYLGAMPRSRRGLLGAVILAALAALVCGSTFRIVPRLSGLALMASGVAVISLLKFPPWRQVMNVPDLDGDIARHGLLATLFVYPLRLRAEPALTPKTLEQPQTGEVPLLIIVQCESFAEPHNLVLDVESTLPGLAAARRRAWRQGRLAVSGFGAYTMRTEYGVLFGRDEDEIGFRRYDPFLSASDVECQDALPNRLRQRFSAYRAAFVHPFPLDFYRRDRLMPQAGFDRLIGETAFSNAARIGPHVSDAALGDRLVSMIHEAGAPDLIYAVTIENHGPWAADRLADVPGAMAAWLHHRSHGDQLLSRLIAELDNSTRPATLCFFGDHLPSIPGEIDPTSDRDTPFVILRFPDQGEAKAAPCRLTPGKLHDLLLDVSLQVSNGPTS